MNAQEMTELPVKMACLDIGDQYQPDTTAEEHHTTLQEQTSKSYRPGLRRRSLPMQNVVPSKRRCNLKPKKLNTSEEKEVNSYYLDKKISFSVAKNLETIYEEPKSTKYGSVSNVGAVRQRRIVFNNVTKAKLRKRKAKIKKVLTGTKGLEKRRLSMDEFLSRLQFLMNRSDSNKETSSTIVSHFSHN